MWAEQRWLLLLVLSRCCDWYCCFGAAALVPECDDYCKAESGRMPCVSEQCVRPSCCFRQSESVVLMSSAFGWPWWARYWPSDRHCVFHLMLKLHLETLHCPTQAHFQEEDSDADGSAVSFDPAAGACRTVVITCTGKLIDMTLGALNSTWISFGR